MHGKMVLSQFFVYFFVFAVNNASFSEESCRQFRRKANVTIDTDQCSVAELYSTKTEEILSGILLQKSHGKSSN